MLNEERVKHMIRLADYEARGGEEEIEISSHYKKDYINMNTMWTLLWMTVGYGFLVFTVWLALREIVTAELTKIQVWSVVILVLYVYLMLFILYMIVAKRYYKKKHAKAHFRVKKFKEDLMKLERMYEKEEQNAENV